MFEGIVIGQAHRHLDNDVQRRTRGTRRMKKKSNRLRVFCVFCV